MALHAVTFEKELSNSNFSLKHPNILKIPRPQITKQVISFSFVCRLAVW